MYIDNIFIFICLHFFNIFICLMYSNYKLVLLIFCLLTCIVKLKNFFFILYKTNLNYFYLISSFIIIIKAYGMHLQRG